MKIMSVNAGSSTLKFKLFCMPSEEEICAGLIEKIGHSDAVLSIEVQKQKTKKIIAIANHQQAIELLSKILIENKILKSLTEIEGVGHRIVQGGELFPSAVILTKENIKQIETLNDLAPLHNPNNILGIKSFQKVLPKVLQVGVFDTTFHQTMQESNFLYATPYEWYTKYKIRKYGAHGISYEYVTQRTQKLLNKKDSKIIICHAGNGVSLAAIQNGKSLDTSMGFTPLEGVPMGTRSGNIDPTIIGLIAEKENKTIKMVLNDLNKISGLLGVSGVSNDGRDLEKMISQNHQRAILAFDIQIKRIVDYIASYYVLLKGIDALVFTAGIGENSIFFRREVVQRLEILNFVLDPQLNENKPKGECIISTQQSAAKIIVVPTNEEIMIARKVFALQQ
ncbi:acetate kinase [Candidatus Phytoplasma phoenicium]|uniref:Acetate kinase n=1 Tax=Candidatus Phytoplasma phoenicium TaxID=198422 RepID=A0A0L0MJ29_9MOLU|nr:acetate kinase [Candidatus Phytoplasma phoenicium]KND62652.1 Acetate kinase [Candidatus Phytoplasma phoenicium]